MPGDDPAQVASGPTVPDRTNAEAARAAIRTYGIELPERLTDHIATCPAPDPDDPVFARNEVRVIASAAKSLEAAARLAAQRGLKAHILSDAIEGEAREVARVHAAIARECAARGRPFLYFANGAAAAEVEVDIYTGEYRVTRVDILHDVGDSLNPAIDLGQVEGGFVQGMGWLTSEELLWNEQGRILSDSPANYKIPTAGDVPEIFNVDFFDRPNNEETVYRAKAVGEPPLMLAISVWCALRDACASLADYRYNPPLGVPATPEQVYFCARAAREFSEATS